MNRDLFLAILALDAYNRAYDQRLGDLPSLEFGADGEPVTTISLGNAQVIDEKGDQEAQQAGFYAIAYEWNGETVISYRGTDKFGQDAVNGYAIGGGFTGLIAPQGDLALEFYSSVTGQSPLSPAVLGDVVLTGHSLGGGLAGLVSVPSGAEAVIFDHMPFVDAAFSSAVKLATEPDSETFGAMLQLLQKIAEQGIKDVAGLAGNLLELTAIGSATPEAFAAAGVRYPTSNQMSPVSVHETD